MLNLSKKVLKETMKSFQIRLGPKGKPINSVGNFGLDVNGISIRSKVGEYTGFSVQAMEYIKPLLNNKKISRVLEVLSEENLQGAISILNVDTEVQKYGLNIIYFILMVWLKKNNFDIPEEINQKGSTLSRLLTSTNPCDKNLVRWITAVSHDPIIGKIKIIGIGQSKKSHSVVPEEWLGREFDSGEQLHMEMDKLDWRKGKPPVHFCCIYSMSIVDVYTWGINTKTLLDIPCKYGFVINKDIKGTCTEFKTDKSYKEWVKVNSKCDFLPGSVTVRGHSLKLVFAVHKSSLINPSPDFISTDNVGVLVSKLQKAIRRGRSCPHLLINSIDGLSKAKPYNLPDQQFIRVSGCRQLLWRLFITIVEDAKPFVNSGKDELDMLDIFILALLCQIDPDIVLANSVIKKLTQTAISVQYNDTDLWKWREGKTTKVVFSNDLSRTAQAFALSTISMPMMKNDLNMLTRGFNHLSKIEISPLKLNSIDFYKKNSNKIVEKNASLASYDMHCLPMMILYTQGSLPFVPNDKMYSTKHIPGYIWTESSRFNVRYKEDLSVDPKVIQIANIVKEIQEFYYDTCANYFKKSEIEKYVKANKCNKRYNNNDMTDLVDRTAFLLLFGAKVRVSDSKGKSYEIIVGGTKEEPCKVKKSSRTKNEYVEGKEREEIQNLYFDKMKTGLDVTVPDPPEGYDWIFKKNNVNIKGEIKKGKKGNEFIFKVDNMELKPFSGGKLLMKIPQVKGIKLDMINTELIKKVMYVANNNNKYFAINRMLRELALYKKKVSDYRVFTWDTFGKTVSSKIWKDILVKIYNNYNNIIQIGPVDRSGKKVDEAISYMREGVLWRMFNFLAYAYPSAVVISGHLKFKINPTTPEYSHMIETLTKLGFRNTNKDNNNKQKMTKVCITSSLWDHQKSTSEKITYGLITEGRKGFGDASHVGAGKTLTALSVSKNIINYNIDKGNTSYKGIIVLLPTTKLYPTWTDEIKKHTKGFIVFYQKADGTLVNFTQNKVSQNDITYNTIIITTLGRMRTHPLSIPSQLVVIDECLSVQNRDALQTEEAWRQVICSQFGVIMMSATFFRSRFDKMFYMLKMLRSGLPEKKEYLDTILSECMVCFIPEKTRNWTTNTTKYALSAELAKGYNNIKKQNMSAEKLYQAMSTFLYSKCDFIPSFDKKIRELNKTKKALIYARSKKEADDISSKIHNVSRYPDKTKTHVVVSYSEGTYGLNDLVGYNTIITRPPEPDKLLQMKGRLDRHGQKSDQLYLEYILTKDTIEEAWLIRMEIANHFYRNHIMPLAEFYDIAVGKKDVKLNQKNGTV